MGPLNGIKILDLTSMVSGPLAATILGDQGADIIKVEPIHGEQLRHLGEPHNGVPASFFSCNRNKKSLAVDLKKQSGKDILWKLIDSTDVLLQNFRPGAMARMGFAESSVRQRNRKIIYVSISGFGKKGPFAHKRVYDPIIQGLSAATDIQADRNTGRPNMFRIILADKVSAMTAAQAVSSALFYRERSGQGQHIELSMLDATLAFFWPEGMTGLTFAEKETDVKKTFSSIDLIYETQDGYVTISVISDNEWSGICKVLKCEELIQDERFASSRARRQHADERRSILGEMVKKWTSQDLLNSLDENDVPCAPLLNRTELMSHPQIIESQTIQRLFFEGFGEVRQARPAARFQLTESEIRLPAPQLGQHSSEVLTSLGYNKDEIDELITKNTVFQMD